MQAHRFFPNAQSLKLTISADIRSIEDCLAGVNAGEHCVFWYIGSNGLKQGAVDYYRPHLTEVLAKGAHNWLVDLSAWASFKKKKSSPSYNSSKGDKIEGDGIRVLKCGEFFDALAAIPAESALCDLLNDIAKRESLLSPSAEFASVGWTIGERFEQACPALEPLYELDCAKTYSVIQYIEFMFLVAKMLEQGEDVNQIRFVLPNDEAKYYIEALESDLQQFLALSKISHGSGLKVIIDCFDYSSEMMHRPYNAPTKVVNNSISAQHIVDFDRLQKDNLCSAGV